MQSNGKKFKECEHFYLQRLIIYGSHSTRFNGTHKIERQFIERVYK